MEIHKDRAISILLLLLCLKECLQFLSQTVDVLCVSRIFIEAELLEELTKADIAVAIFVRHEGVELAQQHRRLRGVVGHQGLDELEVDLAGVCRVEEGEEGVDGRGLALI